MKNTNKTTTQTICALLMTTLELLFLFALCSAAQAQSSSFERPIPLDSLTLRGNLNGSDNERYYSFRAGTDKTEILFEVKASGSNAGATFDLFDKKSRAILSNVLVQSVNRSAERQVESFRLGRQQEVILRVKGVRYGSNGGQGTFTVKIGDDDRSDVPHRRNDATEQPRPSRREAPLESSWDHPILLESNEWRDGLDGSDEEQYFAFIATPGTLKLLFEVQASGSNAGATFDLFDAKQRPLLSNILVQSVNSATEREQQSIRIGREQKLILRVKGVRYGSTGGQGVYRVRITGN